VVVFLICICIDIVSYGLNSSNCAHQSIVSKLSSNKKYIIVLGANYFFQKFIICNDGNSL